MGIYKQDSISVKYLIEMVDSLPKVDDPSYHGYKEQVPLPFKDSVEVNKAPTETAIMRYITFSYNFYEREWEMLLDV